MRKKKRGSDHTGSLNKRQKACKSGRKNSVLHLDSTFEEQFGSLHNSGQGVWSELSKEVASDLSRSVVSLALFDGSTMLFACTGIAIGHELHTTRLHTTRFLTSACLVRAFNDARNIDDNLRIEVRLPSNETAKGYLGLYDRDIAVVTVFTLLNVHRVHLLHQVQSGPHTTVVAAGRAFNSGSLMATSGMLIDGSSGLDREQLMISTCKITKMTGMKDIFGQLYQEVSPTIVTVRDTGMEGRYGTGFVLLSEKGYSLIFTSASIVSSKQELVVYFGEDFPRIAKAAAN